MYDGYQRALTQPELSEIVARLSCVQQDASVYLQQLSLEARPEVIYLDPMFPPRQKAALVKKEMQVLHCLLQDDQVATDLLATALQIASKRVVVKRPLHAPTLEGLQPHHIIATTAMRFDVYLMGATSV